MSDARLRRVQKEIKGMCDDHTTVNKWLTDQTVQRTRRVRYLSRVSYTAVIKALC